MLWGRIRFSLLDGEASILQIHNIHKSTSKMLALEAVATGSMQSTATMQNDGVMWWAFNENTAAHTPFSHAV